MHYVYIIKSSVNSQHYYGSTSNLAKRLKEHNSGKVKSTASGRPWVLHYQEVYGIRVEAQRRERFFKKRSGYRWLKQRGII